MIVKIKTWEAMEKEFGLDSSGDIECKGGFVEYMEKLMPEDRIISVDKLHHCEGFYRWESEKDTYWDITTDMIEEIIRCEEPKGHCCCEECGTENRYPSHKCIDCGNDLDSSAEDLVEDLARYISLNPEMRFWQAVRNWSEHNFIYVSDDLIEDERLKDTFYMRNR